MIRSKLSPRPLSESAAHRVRLAHPSISTSIVNQLCISAPLQRQPSIVSRSFDFRKWLGHRSCTTRATFFLRRPSRCVRRSVQRDSTILINACFKIKGLAPRKAIHSHHFRSSVKALTARPEQQEGSTYYLNRICGATPAAKHVDPDPSATAWRDRRAPHSDRPDATEGLTLK